MEREDLLKASLVHKEAFIRQKLSFEWLECNLNAFPRFLNFVAELEGSLVGYIIWSQKSGFRPEVVLELEQVAVLPKHHGQGVGRELIEESLPFVRDHLAKQGSTLKHIIVTTRADNHAQKLYRSTLGAEVEATIVNLYSADEVFMVARDV
jgi:ribosomal protein S18 acetylase RimI-like enzyme